MVVSIVRSCFLVIVGLVSFGIARAQSTTWNGSISTAWEDSGNWSSGVPDSTKDAVIALATNAPTIGAANADTRALTVQSGATLTLDASYALHVFTGLTINSGGTLTSNGVVDVDGSVSLGNATAVWNSGAGTHTVSGSWTSSGGAVVGTGVIKFDGSGTSALTMGAGTSISNVEVAKTSGTMLLSESAVVATTHTLAIPGNLTVTSGTLQVDFFNNSGGIADGAQITVAGNFLQTGGTTTLTKQAGSGEESTDFARLDVEGDITVSGGLLSMANAEADVFCAGNWDTSASGVFDPTLGLVTLDDGGVVTCLASAFANVTLSNGTDTSVSVPLFRRSVVINSGSLLTLNAATTQLGTLGGTLSILSGGALDSPGLLDVDGSLSLGNTRPSGRPTARCTRCRAIGRRAAARSRMGRRRSSSTAVVLRR